MKKKNQNKPKENVKTPRGLLTFSVRKRRTSDKWQYKSDNILSDLIAAELIRIDSTTGYAAEGKSKAN